MTGQQRMRRLYTLRGSFLAITLCTLGLLLLVLQGPAE